MRRVAVVGVGQTRFGELWDKSLRELVTEAGMEAFMDCSVKADEVGALYVGTMASGQLVNQGLIAPLVLDAAGLADLHVPATHVEGAGASGAMAFRQAVLAVASGQIDVAIAGGVEKPTDVSDREVTRILGAASDQQWEAFVGATDPALHALIARAHMERHGTTRKQLAAVSVKNHANGAKNPKAHFQRAVDEKTVFNSPMIADPIRRLDMAPLSDGAAAAILVPLDAAASYSGQPVEVLASAQGTDYLGLASRKDVTRFEATRWAAAKAYEQSGTSVSDMDLIEAHDSYTINEIIALEDLGVCKPGKASAFIESGRAHIDGDVAVNPSGGLKARGHAMGATGIAQIFEVVQQLRGKSDARQVADAKLGLACNTGGTGVVSVVHILGASS